MRLVVVAYVPDSVAGGEELVLDAIRSRGLSVLVAGVWGETWPAAPGGELELAPEPPRDPRVVKAEYRRGR